MARWSGVLLFFALARGLWEERERRWWFWGLCAAGAVLGLSGLYTGWENLKRGGGENMYGLIPPYYNYTAFVEAALAASLIAALAHPRGPKKGRRLAGFALLGLMLLLITLSRSRGALLAVAASAALLWLRRWDWRRLAAGLTAFAAAVALGTGLMMILQGASPAYLLKLDRVFTRPQLWVSAISAAGDHPWLGEGLGNFGAAFLRHNFPYGSGFARYQLVSHHAHSEPLQLAVETGWIGLFLFLAALYYSRPKPASGYLSESAWAAWAAMSLQCLVDNMLHLPALAFLYFAALACARPEPGRTWLGRPFWSKAVALSGLSLCLASTLPERLAGRHLDRAAKEFDPGAKAEHLSRALEIFPLDAGAREDLSRVYLSLDRLDLALSEIGKAISLSPTNAVLRCLRADVLRLLERGPESLEAAEQALTLEPYYLRARLLKAEALARSGERQAAIAESSRALGYRSEIEALTLASGYARALADWDEGFYESVKRLTEPRRQGFRRRLRKP